MTERTIRILAKELASTFYTEAGGDLFGTAPEDRARSKRFRETYPTLEHYLKGYQVRTDGTIKIDRAGWTYFVSLARARMVQMLQDNTVSDKVKEGIYKALLEEHAKSTSPAAQAVLQRKLNGGGPQIA
jgi:hypothetical protein